MELCDFIGREAEIRPHMHLLGKSYQVRVLLPTGSEVPLINIDDRARLYPVPRCHRKLKGDVEWRAILISRLGRSIISTNVARAFLAVKGCWTLRSGRPTRAGNSSSLHRGMPPERQIAKLKINPLTSQRLRIRINCSTVFGVAANCDAVGLLCRIEIWQINSPQGIVFV